MEEHRIKALKEMEGTQIAALIPFFDLIKLQRVTLHLVEDAGIWIEHQDTQNKILGMARVTVSPKTMVMFFPWHAISVILASRDVPSMSDEALR